jgi:hypothetical protein
MPAPLIADEWRRPAYVVSAVALAVVAALAVVVFRGTSTSFDTWVFDQLYPEIGGGWANALLSFTTPAISISLLALVFVVGLLVHRWDIAALAALGPGVTLFVIEAVLKPLIDRDLGPGLALNPFHVTVHGVYPSGHEATVASTACVLVIVACQLPVRRRARGVFAGVLAVWTVVSALGLVRSFWHYATDTIGAVCLSIPVVLCVAMLLDRYADDAPRREPAARERQLT